MLGKEFSHVRVSGIACAVPDRRVSTDSYIPHFGEEAVDRFKKATGIEARHLSDGRQTASDLGYVAARALMDKHGLTGEDIDALIFITQFPDYKTPASAFVLHKRLNIKKDCLVFDANIGCSAYVNGIYMAAGLVESGAANRVLLLVGDAETNPQVTDDTSFTMMFGDACSATLIERGEGKVRGMIRADGEGFNTLITPVPGARFPGVYPGMAAGEQKTEKKMDGNDVFLFAITKVPKLFKEFFSTFGTSLDDYDYVMLHQANRMIVRQIAKKLKAPEEKVPVSLTEYGNTDGASIPVGIVDLCEGLKKAGGGTHCPPDAACGESSAQSGEARPLRLITSGFGIGLSWGVVSFEIDASDVLPMIFTDEYFLEGKDV